MRCAHVMLFPVSAAAHTHSYVHTHTHTHTHTQTLSRHVHILKLSWIYFVAQFCVLMCVLCWATDLILITTPIKLLSFSHKLSELIWNAGDLHRFRPAAFYERANETLIIPAGKMWGCGRDEAEQKNRNRVQKTLSHTAAFGEMGTLLSSKE